MNNKEMLGTEPMGKLLFKLALPTVAAQLMNMLYNNKPQEQTLFLVGFLLVQTLVYTKLLKS